MSMTDDTAAILSESMLDAAKNLDRADYAIVNALADGAEAITGRDVVVLSVSPPVLWPLSRRRVEVVGPIAIEP